MYGKSEETIWTSSTTQRLCVLQKKIKNFLLKMCSEKLKIITEASFKSVDVFIMTVFFKRRMETSLSKITQTSKELCK